MKRLALASALLLPLAPWPVAADRPAPTTHQVRLNGHTFTLPVGFDLELVAGPPLVDRPITIAFDEQGRLYAADSSGSNEKVQEQLQKKPHRIVRLEDTDGDGRFDRSTVFADRMMFPEGTMWFDGSLYVAAPPSIWKLTDTDGDGIADQRSEWFEGKTLTNCANDLHGPYLGPDGWIYWAKGAFAKQTYERLGKPPFVTRASHIFRCRPDGSGIEPVMTGGMDNPADVVFTPGGERIFTTTFLQHPSGGKRDGLLHAVYGGIYGKNHEVIYEHKWPHPQLMPVLSHLGAAAPCGLTRYESDAFGPEYRDNLFACLFNLHKVTRHVLEPDGASFKSRDEDFLVSDNIDFHPTDVLEDADGSLLVVDTGGWYKLCCPTSVLHKPDVLGAIYRIRRKDAPRSHDPRGLKLDWAKMSAADLASLLDDPRPAVRQRAVQALGAKGAEAIAVLERFTAAGPSAEARRNAVWAATRIDHPGARAAVRQALADPDETVRQAALHSISVRRDPDALPALLKMLKAPSLHNRRAAAEAIGRLGDPAAVPALLEALGQPADRALECSLTYALIEIADRDRTAAGLKSDNVLIRRAALTALDQMDGGGVEAAMVVRELGSTDPRMKETAWWIATRHPEWGGILAGVLRERLSAKNLTAAEREELTGQLARFARAAATQQLLADLLKDAAASRETRRMVLRAMTQAGLREAPESWIAGLAQVLASDDVELLREAVATARALRIAKPQVAKLAAALLPVGNNAKLPADVRLSALAAVPNGLSKVEPALFAFLRAHLGPEQPVAIRSAAADVLARAKLNAEQLLALAELLKSIGPMEVDRLLEPFTHSGDERVGLALIAALKASEARSNLRSDTLRPRLAKFGPKVQEQAEELYAALDADMTKQKAKLEELLGLLKSGDVRRGQAVFNSPKVACSACHAIGYLGGNIGPDLTRIGQIRTERDLLEAIVFPSATFVRSYEPVVIATKDGKTYNGVIRQDTPDEIVLAIGANQEVRLARSEIEVIEPSKVSVMPAGLDQQLTPQELADLVVFLKALK
ncbi:MAG TPA: PVC-type heme-binding CxxCH protein [Gemmataceae bacterium]|nr:PVC-type heme-binding CxxCH protein [Gemmataceae bacterium]